MNYKGQKLSDNLTQSQRDMFRHLIDQGHTIEQIVEMYMRNLKDDYFRRKS
jgi:hypothetical protein